MLKSIILTFLMIPFSLSNGNDDVKIPAYISYGFSDLSVSAASESISDAFSAKQFTLLGEYSPENNPKFKVLVFTRNDLTKLSLKVKDRGMLASVIKVGLKEKDGNVEMSLLNPEYIIYAYWRDQADPLKSQWEPIVKEVRSIMGTAGKEAGGFGGELSISKLMKYHYMFGMPYFDDPVELNTFSSFEAGLATISDNITRGTGKTVKVYQKIDRANKIAVFGVGLEDPEDGEKRFLPIIGERNLAAMPYEIILQDNKATILHGRYRFALHWPDLTMGTFMKIKSTPGYVEDTMTELTTDSSM